MDQEKQKSVNTAGVPEKQAPAQGDAALARELDGEDLVRYAEAIDEEETRRQTSEVETQGAQAGFGNASVEGVLEQYK